MTRRARTWRRILTSTLTGLALPLLADAAPEPIALPQQPAQVIAVSAGPLTLADCLQIGLERQPALAAHRASVAAALTQQTALDNLRLAGLISREVPIRRKQAALGVEIATAGANQAEWEATYAITRNYFSVIYARQQQRVARDMIDSLKATYVAAQTAVQAGARNVTRDDLDRVATYRLLAESRLVDAERGMDRALAALREAMGVACDFPLTIAAGGLPVPRFELTRAQVVELALCRRGELVQAVDMAQVIALEVDAQATSHKTAFRTFASVADIHARPIPQETHNHEYRPGAVGPEMPVSLVGHRKDRMERARDLQARAEAVVAKARNLITLEAENAFFQWRQAADKIGKTREAAARGSALGDKDQKALASDQRIPVKDVLNSLLLGVQARITNNETLYQHLLALADLQRITAGGISLETGVPGPKPEPRK